MQMKKQAFGEDRKRQRRDGSPPTPYMAVVRSHCAAPLPPDAPVQKVPLQHQDVCQDGSRQLLLKPFLHGIFDSSEHCFPYTIRTEEHDCKRVPKGETPSGVRSASPSPLSNRIKQDHLQAFESGLPLSELEEISCNNQGNALPVAATLIKLIDSFSGAGRRKRSDSSDEKQSSDDETYVKSEDQDKGFAPEKALSKALDEFSPPCPLDDQWSERFKDLCNFKAQMGHCSVPHNYEGNPVLARWVKRQRHHFKQLRLDIGSGDYLTSPTKERIRALEDLGFVFDCQRSAWDERLMELREYHNSFLSCNVPSNYSSIPGLAMWVKCQRRQYKLYKDGRKSSMTTLRIRQLEDLGFAWEVRKESKAGKRKNG